MDNKYHAASVYFWLAVMLAVILVFVYAPGLWSQGSMLFLVLVTCYEQVRFHHLSRKL